MARPKDPRARSALVSAARQAFVVHGIQRTRIEDITLACGLSKGAFYLHFESKEALFRELVAELQASFDRLRTDRQRAYQELVSSRGGRVSLLDDPAFLAQVRELDGRQDRRLLELLWEWRDVSDVLLRGCQGTEFAGVVWQVLDLEAARVRDECAALQQVGLIRDDVSGDLVGLMIVGTYLLMARRLTQATQRPDFERLVQELQLVLAQGTAPRATAESAPPKSQSRRARRVRAAKVSRNKVSRNRSAT
jgi:AcrR family transcriptional regulator